MLLSFLPQTNAQVLTRGPYIQSTTPNSTVIRWQTDMLTDSKVWYGIQPGSLNQWVTATDSINEHQLSISGLDPNTKYYYAVGHSGGMLAGDTLDYYFKTHPEVGTKMPFHTLILGDQGTGYTEQYEVRDLYYAQEPGGETPFFITLGDNAYEDGELDEFDDFFFDVYAPFLRRTTGWILPGNHDYHACEPDDEEGPFFDLFTNPQNGEAGGLPSNSQRFYSFDYANVHFVVVEGYLPEGQLEWLEEDLAATTQDWIIGLTHHPPYSKGNHDSDDSGTMANNREQVLPIFEAAGGDLFMGGHSHVYERSFLIHGHYGESDELEDLMVIDGGDGQADGDGVYFKTTTGPNANKGTVYLVSGTSGGKTGDGDLDHPIMVEDFAQPGYGLLEINDNQLHYTFYQSNGVIRDYFTIVKELPVSDDVDQDGFSASVDCDDNNPAINPAATEIPNNSVDENCDGIVLVIDADNDGYNSSIDCDDADPEISPFAIEIPNNSVDENCDGIVLIIDADNDGFNSSIDCNDNNPAINPAATEVPNNGIDEDCDGFDGDIEVDNDNDGYNSAVDCDDNNPNINPGAFEIANNNIDENCDGIIIYIDYDGDGFNSSEDCDDFDPNTYPGATEIPNNDIDEDCDGIAQMIDLDQDGYNSDEDCDDANAAINPGAPEIPNNSIDENCDGIIQMIDLDQDGYNSSEDCNDNNPAVNPGATEIPNNNIDEDCDNYIAIDADQDGFWDDVDCDDNNPNAYPGATEIPNNNVDEDCDGIAQIIDLDMDGFNSDEDCDDNNAAINPAAIDIPNNGIDEDCDGADLMVSLSTELYPVAIKVYPNPATAFLMVETNWSGVYEISVHNVIGEKLMSFTAAGSPFSMDISVLESGLYLLKVRAAELGVAGVTMFVVQ